MSTAQKEQLDAILRQGAFPASADVNEQRQQLKALLSAQPLPADINVTAATLGSVPTAEITVDGIELATLSCTSMAACTCWGTPSWLLSLPRRSPGGPAPG